MTDATNKPCVVCGTFPRRGNSATCDDVCSDRWIAVVHELATMNTVHSYDVPEWLAALYFRVERLEQRLDRKEEA